MQGLLRTLTLADYEFLAGIVKGSFPVASDQQLFSLLEAVREDDNEENRRLFCRRLEQEIRYLGSADIAYFFRKATGVEPGVSFSEIIRDAARKLDVRVAPMSTEREMLAELSEEYATQQFAQLLPEEQQRLLEGLGIEKKRAAVFLKKSAGVFALPAMIEAFGVIVVQGFVKTVIFGMIARIVGRQLASRLFQFLFSRLPWWVGWVAPVAWTLSIGWTMFDVQGPAMRKTIPAVLYLGLCELREKEI